MRLLYLPNEQDARDASKIQVGPRAAFSKFRDQGIISDLKVFSYLSELRGVVEDQNYCTAISNIISEFSPTAVLIQHSPKDSFPGKSWETIRSRFPALFIAYHDEDPYAWPMKRINRAMRAILPTTNIVFISGMGSLRDYYRNLGAKNIRYVNHYFDKQRNGRIPLGTTPKEYAAVMIGNSGRHSRAPLFYYPGGRRRARLVHELNARFGSSFSLYGSGWDRYPCSKGRISWSEQEAAIRKARVSVNWDHFDKIPYYCSDRLPISLAAAVPHVTSYHQGYEHIFGQVPGLYFGRTPKECVDIVEWLNSRPQAELDEEGRGAREWCFAHMEAEAIFGQIISAMKNEQCKDLF